MVHSIEGSIVKAWELQEALWATGIAYGDPPRLWSVSPKWYYLWEKQWQQIVAFGDLLPALRRVVDGDDGATYLRADFTLDHQGKLVLVELNDMPVWDYGTQAVREVYHRVLGLPEKTKDPFPGAASAIAAMLARKFPKRRIVILLSPDRLKYSAEYSCLAAYFAEQGLEAVVKTDGDKIREGDVVYRTFNRDWLTLARDFPGVENLLSLIQGGEVTIWPPFTHLEDKVWMTYPFGGGSANGLVSAFNSTPLSDLGKFMPPTWLVDPASIGLPWKKRTLRWHANELMGDLTTPNPKKDGTPTRHDWVLKRALGAQGKGTAFSSWISPEEWRGRLLEALMSVNGRGPHYVIQPEVKTLRHKMTCLSQSGGGLVEKVDLRLRLCVAYLLEGDRVEIIDADATLVDRPLVHGSSDAISLPVIVRT